MLTGHFDYFKSAIFMSFWTWNLDWRGMRIIFKSFQTILIFQFWCSKRNTKIKFLYFTSSSFTLIYLVWQLVCFESLKRKLASFISDIFFSVFNEDCFRHETFICWRKVNTFALVIHIWVKKLWIQNYNKINIAAL